MARHSRTMVGAIAALLVAGTAAAQNASRDFVPDYTFQGSQLAGWTPVGQADWRAENGTIVGRPRSAAGGWLVLDRSYQDVGFFSRFRCASPCKAGVLLRAEQTPQGMRGIFVSLADDDLVPYRVTISSDGRELTRERLGRSTSVRTAPPPNPLPANAQAAQPAATPAVFGPVPPAGVKVADLQPPKPGIWPNEWNDISIIVDANIVRPNLNWGNQIPLGHTGDESAGYGKVALYVGGSSEVRFQNVATKDIGLREVHAETVSPRFRMQRLDDFSRGWDAAAADVNRDGIMDVVAGGIYYLGPDYTQSREIFISATQTPGMDYVANMITHAQDFNGDGWTDVMSGSYGTRPMAIYINPKGENRRWDRHPILPGLVTELSIMEDVDGDRVPEILYVTEGTLAYAKFTPAQPIPTWTTTKISEPGYSYGHSFGLGDINGDGRKDILQTAGWWEQPAPGSGATTWKYHPQAFARWSRSQVAGGGHMAVWDVNGDGLNDVVSSLNAHGWGLAWFQQKRDAQGNISFDRHMIMDDFSTQNAGGVTFSELHSGAIPADFDGDGVMDFVTGKRFFAHLDTYTDADPHGAAVLYLYRGVRDASAPGGMRFVPELIHNRSGVGSLFKVVDLNNDAAPDIITSATRGTYIFWGTPRPR